MSINKSFIIELNRELESTSKLIACVPNNQWDWRPHTKSMTIGELAKHIVELTIWTEFIVNKPVFDFTLDYQHLELNTSEELVKLLFSYKERVNTALEKMSEENWMDLWTLQSGEYKIAEMPKVGANRFIVNNHIYHHRGQLSVYLRLLDIPIPGMYGPSADDK